MHQDKNKQNKSHQPVLLEEVLTYLQPKVGESYLDLTAGYGGHASEVLDRTKLTEQSVLVDRDSEAIAHLQAKFEGEAIELLQSDYRSASEKLCAAGRSFDCILADLGVSSPHLDKASRGFSIHIDEPLDMRMDQRQTLTAETIVNTYSEEKLSRLLYDYGEEPKARQIARRIIRARPVRTTAELAAIPVSAWGHGKRHPAIRTFQALRIAVNDELTQLKSSLPLWIKLLKPGGRLAVISFHSLEDRIVKQAFAKRGGNRYDADVKVLTKQPVRAGSNETVFNPRARSAKLRAVAKINT